MIYKIVKGKSTLTKQWTFETGRKYVAKAMQTPSSGLCQAVRRAVIYRPAVQDKHSRQCAEKLDVLPG